MALPICAETGIRLFLEILKFLGFDPTAAAYIDLGAMLGAIKWVFLFLIVKVLIKNRLAATAVIASIPMTFNLVGSFLGLIPFVGWLFTIFFGLVAAGVSAIAWSIIILTDDRINILLRIIALPGMMILGAVNALLPFIGIATSIGAAALFAYIPYLMIGISLMLYGLIVYLSPAFLCGAMNNVIALI